MSAELDGETGYWGGNLVVTSERRQKGLTDFLNEGVKFLLGAQGDNEDFGGCHDRR